MRIQAGNTENINAMPEPASICPEIAEAMTKLEEISCLLAGTEIIAQAAYDRGFRDGRDHAA